MCPLRQAALQLQHTSFYVHSCLTSACHKRHCGFVEVSWKVLLLQLLSPLPLYFSKLDNKSNLIFDSL